jgi:hypothetical protein
MVALAVADADPTDPASWIEAAKMMFLDANPGQALACARIAEELAGEPTGVCRNTSHHSACLQ